MIKRYILASILGLMVGAGIALGIVGIVGSAGPREQCILIESAEQRQQVRAMIRQGWLLDRVFESPRVYCLHWPARFP